MIKFVVAVALYALVSSSLAVAAERPLKLLKPKVNPRPGYVPMSQPDARIVGGVEAIPHEFPHQVALTLDNSYFCGGSLISQDYVLTAAHCTDGISVVEVLAGAHNRLENEPTQQKDTSVDILTHANFGSFSLKNDIAVIGITSITFVDGIIGSIGLSPSFDADPSVGTIVTPSGWGKTADGALQGISDVLMKVDVPIISVADCDAVYSNNVDETQICISSVGGMGTCNGDSGGPLNYNRVTVGITSFGASAGCEEGYPDAFTRVSAFLDWIQANTGVTP